MVVYKKSPLVEFIRTSSKGDVLKLRRAMKYIFGYKSLTVPKGFSCDGMSVPRFLWSIISPTIHPETIAASIGHDYLYQHGSSKGWSRWQADLFFYCVLRCDGVSVWRAAAAFAGVRLFGAQFYKNKGVNNAKSNSSSRDSRNRSSNDGMYFNRKYHNRV